MGAALILIADVLWFAIGLRNTGFTVLALLLLLGVQRLGAHRIKVAANWLRGARSEEAVGETLAALTGEGYAVLHDIPQEFAGNIDHLVSGPSGVYMIETKHRRYQRGDLRKAKRQAAMLRDELGVWVTPVICLDQRRDRDPFRSEGVWIVCRTRPRRMGPGSAQSGARARSSHGVRRPTLALRGRNSALSRHIHVTVLAARLGHLGSSRGRSRSTAGLADRGHLDGAAGRRAARRALRDSGTSPLPG